MMFPYKLARHNYKTSGSGIVKRCYSIYNKNTFFSENKLCIHTSNGNNNNGNTTIIRTYLHNGRNKQQKQPQQVLFLRYHNYYRLDDIIDTQKQQQLHRQGYRYIHTAAAAAATTTTGRCCCTNRWLSSSSRLKSAIGEKDNPGSSNGNQKKTDIRNNDAENTQTPKYPRERIISYITDIEGDAEYLNRYVKQSKVLCFKKIEPRFCNEASSSCNNSNSTDYDPNSINRNSNNNPNYGNKNNINTEYFPYDHCIDFVNFNYDDCNDNSILVHGGDIWDQGGSDLYVIRQLLDLKRRYPNRVFFIMGNRDINKMRILQELGIIDTTSTVNNSSVSEGKYASKEQKHSQQSSTSSSSTSSSSILSGDLPHHPGVYWLRNSGRRGDPNDANSSLSHFTNVERLQWMLGETMGCPRSFELRRLELMEEKRKTARANVTSGSNDKDKNKNKNTNCDVSDKEVLDSYRKSCHPFGEMGMYLSNATLALRLDEVLFIHGSLPITNDIIQQQMVQTKCSNQSPSSFWDDLSFAMPWINPNTKETTKSYNDEVYSNSSTLSLSSSYLESGRKNDENSIDCWIHNLNNFAEDSVNAWRSYVTQVEREHHQQNQSFSATTEDSDSILKNHRQQQQQQQQLENCIFWSSVGGYAYENENKKYPFHVSLQQYGMGWTPNKKRNPTIVYSSWFDRDKLFHPDYDISTEQNIFTNLTKEFFQKSNIRLILSGHQPQGDHPSPIRISIENNELAWVLCCDTSYSGDTMWCNPAYNEDDSYLSSSNGGREEDNKNEKDKHHYHQQPPSTRRRQNLGRGKSKSGRGEVAVTETLVKQHVLENGEWKTSDVRCHGVLSDGSRYETFGFPFNKKQEEALMMFKSEVTSNSTSKPCFPLAGTLLPTEFVPRCSSDGYAASNKDVGNEVPPPENYRWWTKVMVKYISGDDNGEDRLRYLVMTAKGFNVWNSTVKL